MGLHFSDCETTLAKSIDDLQQRWLIAASGWNDKAREDFDKEYMQELRDAVKRAQQGMRNINVLLRQVAKECSE